MAVETDHREAIAAMVVAGAGVALLPRQLAEDARRQGAVLREITPRIRRTIGLIRRDGPRSPAARAFVSMTIPIGARDRS